jgi:hypothetical protein
MNAVAGMPSEEAGPILGTSIKVTCAMLVWSALSGMALGQRRPPEPTPTTPQTITVTTAPVPQSNYPHTTSALVWLAGQADALRTHRVTVNGQPAVWTAALAQWSIANVSLVPGIDRVVIQAFDANETEIDRFGLDIWYDTGAMTTKAGGTLGADETWTAAGGPYHVTGSITIPAGRTLTIQPGTTVFGDAKCGFTVNGQLTAQGTEYQRIRFTRIPGSSGSWRGLDRKSVV